MNPITWWRSLPPRTRSILSNTVKLLVTVAGFWLLLTHEVGTWVGGEKGAWYAPIEHEVAEVTVDGAPFAAIPPAAFAAGDVGWYAEPDVLHVRLPGNARPGKRVVATGEPHLGRMPIATAIGGYLDKVDTTTFLLWSLVAMAIKFVGVISSAFGWYLLLRGQRVRFPFWQQVMTAFLIGRFIGTFMPSTIGLDGYTLFEAGRYSNQWHRVITAKALEKFIGIAGLFTGLLLTLPAGYVVLHGVVGERAGLLTVLIGVVSGGVTGGVVVGLVWPHLLRVVLDAFGRVMPGPVRKHVERFTDAVTAYHGQLGILFGALLAKFVTHFTTAVVYYFTALAIGVTGVAFLPVVFGSLIQIFGTLFSPTIAGEGAREAIQALLLSQHLGGAAQAVLSAALGFVAAEAATLWGGMFLWVRRPGWRPTFVEVDGAQVDYAWLPADDAPAFDADALQAKLRTES